MKLPLKIVKHPRWPATFVLLDDNDNWLAEGWEKALSLIAEKANGVITLCTCGSPKQNPEEEKCLDCQHPQPVFQVMAVEDKDVKESAQSEWF